MVLFASCSTLSVTSGVAWAQASCATSSSSTITCNLPTGSVSQPFNYSDPTHNITATNNGNITINGLATSSAIGIISQANYGTPKSPLGSSGSQVNITNNGTISLTSNANQQVSAILANSVGGNGAMPADTDNGGNGGNGSYVTLNNTHGARVAITGGNFSNGVIGLNAITQGGNGGQDHTGLIDKYGGNGGQTRAVTLNNAGTVMLGSALNPLTGGNRAWGIASQALGGAGGGEASSTHSSGAQGQGGNAGSATNASNPDVSLTTVGGVSVHWAGSGSSTATNSVAGAVAMSQGGQGGIVTYVWDIGGDGGSGGYVSSKIGDGTHATSITVQATNATSDASAGVLALSSGGVGGAIDSTNATGGLGGAGGNVDVTMQYATIQTQGDNVVGIKAASVGAIGGGLYPNATPTRNTIGGNGGKAGNVAVTLLSADEKLTVVETAGQSAYGILAQSVGGMGGGARSEGGTGADAGHVYTTLTSGAIIKTTGDYATGVVAQSIGGGGGTGTNFSKSLAGSGGNGGNGGSGSNVELQLDGRILTQGDHAYGVLGQTIGGSGGTGTITSGLIALGGDGGAGGGAGTVTIRGTGHIQTAGDSAIGLLAQSIGGGGGAAGSATGLFAIGGSVSDSTHNSGGTVTLDYDGSITTTGDAAIGMLGQSIGGGGGSGGSSMGIASVGGSGNSGGAGGDVTVNANSTISTTGLHAHGAVSQSIGGGGGNGGSSFGVSPGLTLGPTLGGSAGTASSGGTATLTTNQIINTQGDGANALVAQSIGGGGGIGGSATKYSLATPFGLSIGGSGTGGGNGGQVNVTTTNARLNTIGTIANGIVAQSIGGGGGNGGAAHAFDANVGFSSAIALGGRVGRGGQGGTVTVTVGDTTIATAGLDTTQLPHAGTGVALNTSDAIGILAQSIGGGGGNGGSTAASSLIIPLETEDGAFAITTNVAVGATGGTGGSGGEVDLTLTGKTNLYTAGQGSHAVLAQSIGGGGGNGGTSKAMSISVPLSKDTLNATVNVAVGGSSGGGGNGGAVNLKLNNLTPGSQITTYDDLSNGVMAQSIGGGGGNAGVGSSKTGGFAKGQSITATVGVGGTAGTGGQGGTVTATLPDGTTVSTYGSGSRGAIVQSIGGGGGTAQGTTVALKTSLSIPNSPEEDEEKSEFAAKVNVSIGGQGGNGGSGGATTLTSTGLITTIGGDADGIVMQSIGGGGGLGGSAGNDASAGTEEHGVEIPERTGYTLAVSVGGKGGVAGNGALNTLNYGGWTTTQGDYADAIVVQSIGGGGGVGGVSASKSASGTLSATIGVGGSGGTAGQGGNINLNMAGNDTGSHGVVQTTGDVAYGLLAQSIGGGGGQGVASGYSLPTTAVLTPSIFLGLGGSGGNSGAAGTISMNADNSMFWASTQGFNSHAVVLQSIGGGGGTAALSSATISPGLGLGLSANLGGGGSPNEAMTYTGGAIDVDTWLSAATSGEHAFGLVAQAIGGGGGIAATGAASNLDSALIQIDSSGGGGRVNVTLKDIPSNATGAQQSSITTSGKGSHAIVLQSIGGGGGIAGYTANGPLQTGWKGGSSSTLPHGGFGNTVSLTLDNANIITTGDNAYGVIAQSIADGGGLGGTSSGSFAGSVADHSKGLGNTAGSINIQQSGTLRATGDDSVGIFAQSDGKKTNTASITIGIDGNVTGGSGSGVGIWVDGTASTNTIRIGNGASVQAGSGQAIKQTGVGSAVVMNYGDIVGSMSLSDVGVALGSLTNFGNVHDANTIHANVINHGNMHLGSPSGIRQTRVSGDFRQHDAGLLHLNADFLSGDIDSLHVDGTAKLNGAVQVNAKTLMPNKPLTFMYATGPSSHTSAIGTSRLFDFTTRYSQGTATIEAGKTAHFDRLSDDFGIARNPESVGKHLQDIWARGGSEALAGVYATLDHAAAQGRTAYRETLQSLSPGVSAAPAIVKQGDMASFANALLSCPNAHGITLPLSESACVWGQINARHTSIEGSHGTSGFDSDTVSYQIGTQHPIAPHWFAGAAVAYETSHIKDHSKRQSIRGDSGYLGGSLKYEKGPWMMAAALTASYGSFDSKRNIRLAGEHMQAKGSPDLMALGQRLRLAYTQPLGNAYIKPFMDMDLNYTRMGAYSENGANHLNLHYKRSNQWAAMVTPSIEVGGMVELGKGYVARPYASIGLSLSSSDHWDTHARLAGSSKDSTHITSRLDTGNTFGRIAAGVHLMGEDRLDVRLQYDGVFSDKTNSHGGSLKGVWRF